MYMVIFLPSLSEPTDSNDLVQNIAKDTHFMV